jgi:hypothetical protein
MKTTNGVFGDSPRRLVIHKAIAIAVLALVPCAAPTINAQSYSTIRPDYMGGYNIWNSNGSSSTIRPDYMGGYNVWNSNGSSSTIRPDYMGGYNVWNYGGGFGTGSRGYNPGVTYHGDQYLYQGISAFGNGIAEAIRRNQERKQQQQLYNELLKLLAARQSAPRAPTATRALADQQRRIEAIKRHNAAWFAKHSAAKSPP